jgi:hypothetical protein
MAVVIELRRCNDDVQLSADAWNVSTAVAGGEATPQQVAAHLRWQALRTCRAVKELVDSGRAVLSAPERRAVTLAGSASPLWPGWDAGWRTPWYDPGE